MGRLLQAYIDTAHIDSGKPWHNGKNERINGKFRDECLSMGRSGKAINSDENLTVVGRVSAHDKSCNRNGITYFQRTRYNLFLKFWLDVGSNQDSYPTR